MILGEFEVPLDVVCCRNTLYVAEVCLQKQHIEMHLGSSLFKRTTDLILDLHLISGHKTWLIVCFFYFLPIGVAEALQCSVACVV